MTTNRSAAYWLANEGGRVLITHASVIVGRNPDCDIVLDDARVSRRHALFHAIDEGVEVLPFGAQPVMVNGAAVEGPSRLRDGDRVEFEGHVFTIVEAPAAPPPERDTLWGVERTPGSLFRIAQSPFRVGGAIDDHLHIEAWPATVLMLHRVGDALALEAAREGVHANGPLAIGECVRVESGARVAYGGQSLRLVALPRDPARVTERKRRDELPTWAELQFLPRGGKLSIRFGARTQSVYLSDRRCDLVACLLRPPTPFDPGGLVPDEVLIERIWPHRTHGRVELNTLVFRTRKELIKGEIDGTALIERIGGAVRFRIAPGATTSVVTG